MNTDFLQDTLYPYEQNKQNYSLLLDNYSKKSFVAFIGAGLPANMKDMPDWKELAKKLADDLHVNLPKAKKEIIENEPQKLPIIFSYIYKRCSKKATFYSRIFSMLSSKCIPPEIYVDLKKAFSCLVSTNLSDRIPLIDESQEKGMNRFYFKIPESVKIQYNSITYLHGHEDIGFGIVRQEDYDYFYPSGSNSGDHASAVEESLRYVYTKKSTVLFGCSLESSLVGYFNYLKAKGYKSNQHYWITSQSSIGNIDGMNRQILDKKLDEFFNKYKHLGINPVVYRDDHIFLSRICERLSQIKDISSKEPSKETEMRI